MLRFIPLLGMITKTLACVPQDGKCSSDNARGKQLYLQKCAACHGAQLKGAGPESLGLGAPPPNLRGLSAANGGIFLSGFVLSKIYGPLGHNSVNTAMLEFGDDDLGPLVQVEEDGMPTPTPADPLALATLSGNAEELIWLMRA